MSDINQAIEDTGTGENLCEKCGSIKVQEDGKFICPTCDVQIDYFGEDDEDDTK